MKKWILIISLFIIIFLQFVFATNVFEQYKKDFINHWWFPVNSNDKIQKLLINSPYDSVYIYANNKDFLWLVDPNKRNKQDFIITKWFIIKKNEITDNSLRQKFKNNIFPPKIILFTWKTTLRWGLSLDCWKPSFKIKNDNLDFTYKLKWFCGASYWIEEKLFWYLIKGLWNNLLNKYYVFFKPQEYKKVFINWRLYWLYIQVPAFNKQYLIDTNVIYPKKKKNCILKVWRFVVPSIYPDFWLTSRLEYTWKPVDKKQIDFVLETKYWNDKVCYDKKKKLLDIINKPWLDFDEIKQMVNVESVLMWWLILRQTNNHISFTHNYLLVENNWKFSMWFWDIENFEWCKWQNIDNYFKKDNWQYNVLFTKVLKRYLKNNPQKIKDFEKKIAQRICNYDSYLRFKNENLKYVLADRFMWWLWNFTPVDSKNEDNIKYDLIKAYKNKLNFQKYFKKQYNLFDQYFGFSK